MVCKFSDVFGLEMEQCVTSIADLKPVVNEVEKEEAPSEKVVQMSKKDVYMMQLELLCHEAKIFYAPKYEFDIFTDPIFDVDEVQLNDEEEILENLKIIFWLSENQGAERPQTLKSKLRHLPIMA